jgi:HSP20 family protein
MRNVAFTRWDPLRDLLSLQEQIGHLVGSDAPGWTPPVDLYETPADFVLTAELPGFSREQIELHAEDHRIVIRGERSAPHGRPIASEQYHRIERGHGRFSRAFALPAPIDVTKVAADLKDGVLTVTMPKAARGAHHVAVS